MLKHSSEDHGDNIFVNSSLWPDCVIKNDPYRLPAHFAFEAPRPDFTSVAVKRTVSIYKAFAVITDRMGSQSTNTRIIALEDFDGVVVRVGFSGGNCDRIGSAVYLHHAELGLDLPLYVADDCEETAVVWLAWSRALGVPAMSFNENEELCDPFNRIGELNVGNVVPRRTPAHIAERPIVKRQATRQARWMASANTGRSFGRAKYAVPGAEKPQSNVYSLFG